MAQSLASALLRRWRDERGWPQTRAAEALQVDQARYSQFERGIRKPGRKAAVRIELGTDGRVPVSAWELPPPIHGEVAAEPKAS